MGSDLPVPVWSAPASGGPSEPPVDRGVEIRVAPSFGMEDGVRTFDSFGSFVLRYDELFPEMLPTGTATFGDAALGFLGRLARGVFVDATIATTDDVFVHEVFGHGARFREAGIRPTYRFSIQGIWKPLLSPGDDGFEGLTSVTDQAPGDRAIVATAGGLEAQYFGASYATLGIARDGGSLRHGEALLYVEDKFGYATSFFSSGLLTGDGFKDGDDVDSYVKELADRWNVFRPDGVAEIARRLQIAYAWNFADPTLAFALYDLGAWLVTGDEAETMPIPKLHGVSILPTTRFGLTPFGAEHYVDVILAKGGAALDVYGRDGSSGLAAYDGVGARLVGLPVGHGFEVGANLDAFRQPVLHLDARAAYDDPEHVGGAAGIELAYRVGSHVSVEGKFAYKSSGYVLAAPLDAGPYGFLGVALRP